MRYHYYYVFFYSTLGYSDVQVTEHDLHTQDLQVIYKYLYSIRIYISNVWPYLGYLFRVFKSHSTFPRPHKPCCFLFIYPFLRVLQFWMPTLNSGAASDHYATQVWCNRRRWKETSSWRATNMWKKQFIEKQKLKNRTKMIRPTDCLYCLASVQNVLRAVLTVCLSLKLPLYHLSYWILLNVAAMFAAGSRPLQEAPAPFLCH